ncbi:MAG: hypothetical protein H0T60_14920 [Acidobacteria bacterium]|nr:hypothetical protein [Acidobacteriota bacterium]
MNSINAWLANVPEGWVLFAACVTLTVLFALVGLKSGAEELKFTEAEKRKGRYEKPMLAFEFNAGEGEQMFESWPDAKKVLRAALMWDFLFIFIYPALITAVCLVGAKYLDANGYVGFRISLFFILLALAAAALDAVENCVLLAVLADNQRDIFPSVAYLCAKVKFTLVYIAASYALLACGAAGLLWLYNFFTSRTPLPS